MELDEFQLKWAEQDRKLELSLRLNRQLLSESHLNRAKSAMQRLAWGLGIEAILTFVAVTALGDFLYTYRSILRFMVPAIALDLGEIAVLIALIHQITLAAQIDYNRPITAIQKRIEALRVLRIRYVQGIFLGATLAWLPLLIVTFKGFFGLDAYRLFNSAWMIANLLFGLAIIPVAIWLSRRFGNHWGRFPLVQQFRNDLMGHNLNAALGFLATLSDFENEK